MGWMSKWMGGAGDGVGRQHEWLGWDGMPMVQGVEVQCE